MQKYSTFFNHILHFAVSMRNCQINFLMHDKILQKRVCRKNVVRQCDFVCLCSNAKWTLFNSLSSIDTSRCLCGGEVTHQATVPEIPDWVHGSDKDFDVCFLVCCSCVFIVWRKTCYLSWKVAISFAMLIYFSILNILESVWPIIKLSRYRDSIFKCCHCGFLSIPLIGSNIKTLLLSFNFYLTVLPMIVTLNMF